MAEIRQTNIDVENERKLREWPSINLYQKRKEQSINKYTPILDSIVRKNSFLSSSLSPEKIKQTTRLLSYFVFGSEMAYSRFGESKVEMNIKFVDSSVLGSSFIGIENGRPDGKTWFIFNAPLIAECANKYDLFDRLQGFITGGMHNPNLSDAFEIGGVEETAHHLFEKIKKRRGKPTVWAENEMVALYTSDPEYRALLWKVDYVKRYKPERPDYESELNLLINQVRQARTNIFINE